MSTIFISNLFQSNDVKKGDIAMMCQNAWGGGRNLCLVFLEDFSERINMGYVGIDGRIILKCILQNVGWHNSVGTGWMVRGFKPIEDKIFRTLPDWPCGPPSLLYEG
jgi:hypothetical protein